MERTGYIGSAEIKYLQAWKHLKLAVLQLKQLLHTSRPFDYLAHVKQGPTLFVGEGNLSFALSLALCAGHSARNITATTFEPKNQLSEAARQNAAALKSLGARVIHGVDATKLEQYFSPRAFGLIVFQFPNVASREALYGRNPNHILMRRFLRNAAGYIRRNGRVAITVVNSPYYDGTFAMVEAARRSGFKEPIASPFYFEDHPGYSHLNTGQEDASAIEKEEHFVTFVLMLKA